MPRHSDNIHKLRTELSIALCKQVKDAVHDSKPAPETKQAPSIQIEMLQPVSSAAALSASGLFAREEKRPLLPGEIKKESGQEMADSHEKLKSRVQILEQRVEKDIAKINQTLQKLLDKFDPLSTDRIDENDESALRKAFHTFRPWERGRPVRNAGQRPALPGALCV